MEAAGCWRAVIPSIKQMIHKKSTKGIGMFLVFLIVLAVIPHYGIAVELDSCEKQFLTSQDACEEAGCSWCSEGRNCDQLCPCRTDCGPRSGYEESCSYDADCKSGYKCVGTEAGMTGFLHSQACCNEDELWNPDTENCEDKIDLDDVADALREESQKTEEIEYTPYSTDYSEYESGTEDSFYPPGCNIGVCVDLDMDCDGKEDDICLAQDEICDGIDNDMDGVVDDGVCAENCGHCGDKWHNGCDEAECLGLGNCVFEKGLIWGTCKSAGAEKFCLDSDVCDNFVDDDCNGKIDDGCQFEDFFNPELPPVEDIGLKNYQEYYCMFDGQCNPGLKCKGVKPEAMTMAYTESIAKAHPMYWVGKSLDMIPSSSEVAEMTDTAGACCYDFQEWSHEDRECYDTRMGPHILGCESDEECRPGLHCSWDTVWTSGACCPEGTEYDTEAGRCIECGVIATKGDDDYCTQKEEVGCTCNDGQGNCRNDEQCYSGSYCSSTKSWVFGWLSYDICCPKGSVYDPDTKNCTESAIGICHGDTKEACFSSGASCCFENNECGTCTDINRNERMCVADTSCCDMENGCDFSVNLTCSTGVCCYPWEEENEHTGRCSIECPDCDTDEDGFSNEFEQRVYSNPFVAKDTPWLRLGMEKCGSMFELPTNAPAFSIRVPNEKADEVAEQPESSGPGALGFLGGIIGGVIGGLWDDLSLIPMLLKGAASLVQMAAFAANDPQSASVRAGYSWDQVKGMTSSIWHDFGKIVSEGFNDGLNSISAQGEWLSPFGEDCPKVEFTKGYSSGYFIGYVVWQIAMLFVGITEVKAAVQAGFGATKIGSAIVKGITFIEKVIAKALKPFKWATKTLMDNIAVTVKKLLIRSFQKWGDDAIEGFARIVKHGGNSYARRLMGEMGEAGLKRASKKIAKIAADYGDDAVELMIKSKIGKLALQQNWAAKSQQALIRALKEVGEESLDTLAKGATKTTLRKMGARLNRLAGVGDDIALDLLKSKAAKAVLVDLSDDAMDSLMTGIANLQRSGKSAAQHIDDVGELINVKGFDDMLSAAQSGRTGRVFEITGNAQLNRQAIGGGVDQAGIKVKRPDGSDLTDIDGVMKDGSIVEMKFDMSDEAIHKNVQEWASKIDTTSFKNARRRLLIDHQPSETLIASMKKVGIDPEDIFVYDKGLGRIRQARPSPSSLLPAPSSSSLRVLEDSEVGQKALKWWRRSEQDGLAKLYTKKMDAVYFKGSNDDLIRLALEAHGEGVVKRAADFLGRYPTADILIRSPDDLKAVANFFDAVEVSAKKFGLKIDDLGEIRFVQKLDGALGLFSPADDTITIALWHNTRAGAWDITEDLAGLKPLRYDWIRGRVIPHEMSHRVITKNIFQMDLQHAIRPYRGVSNLFDSGSGGRVIMEMYEEMFTDVFAHGRLGKLDMFSNYGQVCNKIKSSGLTSDYYRLYYKVAGENVHSKTKFLVDLAAERARAKYFGNKKLIKHMDAFLKDMPSGFKKDFNKLWKEMYDGRDLLKFKKTEFKENMNRLFEMSVDMAYKQY